MTEASVRNMLSAFIAAWSGKKADYPTGEYSGECLSLVKRWVDTLAGKTIAPTSGNGYADGYYSNFPSPLGSYFTKEPFIEGISYPAGSIIIYPVTHHAAIVVSSTGGAMTTEVFEQNANPDGSASHLYNRANTSTTPAEGILVPITQIPEPSASYINLSSSVTAWHLYPLGVEPMLSNALKTTLNPKKFGGLSYTIHGEPYPNTYTISTADFGMVNIYKDEDGSITSTPLYRLVS